MDWTTLILLFQIDWQHDQVVGGPVIRTTVTLEPFMVYLGNLAHCLTMAQSAGAVNFSLFE